MKKPFFLSLLAFSLTWTACDPIQWGKGDLMTETRDAADFNALEISTCGQVEVRTDSVFSVEVTCEENVLPYLETVVDDGVLKIYFDRPVLDVDGLRIRVSAPNWDGFELSGSAKVNVPDAIEGDYLRVKISGSGDVNLANADFSNAKIQISGSGEASLSGAGEVLDCQVSGSGDLESLGFVAQRATVSVSGSGSVRLQVSEKLDATLSGSGDIEYRGDPQVTSSISGSGKIRKI
jgi:hypothetical protein